MTLNRITPKINGLSRGEKGDPGGLIQVTTTRSDTLATAAAPVPTKINLWPVGSLCALKSVADVKSVDSSMSWLLLTSIV
jgi:hypothetical protein